MFKSLESYEYKYKILLENFKLECFKELFKS